MGEAASRPRPGIASCCWTAIGAAMVWALLVAPPAPANAAPPGPLAGQTVTIVEPFGAGSITETVLRLLKPGMERALGARLSIETQRSPEGTTAFETVLRAAPDGRTLLAITDATRLFHERLSGSTAKLETMRPVAKLTDGVSLALATAVDSPIQDYQWLFKRMREGGARPSLALYGAASPAGVFAAILEDDIGARFGQRAYQVDPEIVESLRSRRVELGVLPTPALLNKANNLRGLLTSGAKRHPALPEVPTFVEESLKRKLAFTVAVGLFGPPGMSTDLAFAIRKAAAEAAKSQEVKAAAQAAGLPIAVRNATVLRETMARTQRVIRDLLAP
jgi:tripartite-type tricarboxylate transporter receptor subunit TctC